MAFGFFVDISRATGIKAPEVAFVFSQLTALVFSLFLRNLLRPTWVPVEIRYISQFAVGFFMTVACFGSGCLHILVDGTIAYIMILTIDPKYCQHVVFIFSMLYMSAIHIYQMWVGIPVNNLDYIGPLMVLTEKLSSLGWSLHDGLVRDEHSLNDLQKRLAVRKYPSVLQFYSFIFYPQGLLAGPVSFYAEYERFVEGTDFIRKVKNERGEEVKVYDLPSATGPILRKFFFTTLSAMVLVTLVPRYPIMRNVDEEFLKSHGFFYRLGYLLWSIEVAKSKYFFAWLSADAINNIAGLGFNGYDEKGQPKWDYLTNIRIWDFQTATSMKILINSWNITGARWLRHVCFDRIPFQKKFATFVLSSIWHGFYPGFFFTFISASLMVAASQKVRYNVRHYFLSPPPLKAVYDVFTWFCTHLTLAYFIAPFTFLDMDLCLRYFNSLYWFIHIPAFIALLVLPGGSRSKPKEKLQLNGHVTSSHQNGTTNHAEDKKEL